MVAFRPLKLGAGVSLELGACLRLAMRRGEVVMSVSRRVVYLCV